MYEAPDRYKRMVSARLPGGESLALTAGAQSEGSSPLRDVQLISRAQLAPFFAAANTMAALLIVAELWLHVPALFRWTLAQAIFRIPATIRKAIHLNGCLLDRSKGAMILAEAFSSALRLPTINSKTSKVSSPSPVYLTAQP